MSRLSPQPSALSPHPHPHPHRSYSIGCNNVFGYLRYAVKSIFVQRFVHKLNKFIFVSLLFLNSIAYAADPLWFYWENVTNGGPRVIGPFNSPASACEHMSSLHVTLFLFGKLESSSAVWYVNSLNNSSGYQCWEVISFLDQSVIPAIRRTVTGGSFTMPYCLYIENGVYHECKNSLTLTLTPAPNQTPLDPRPAGTGSRSTQELIATVMENGSPKAGVAVTFALEVEANSGGHDHHDASRPKGKVIPSSTSTDSKGEITVVFQASQVAGKHVVAAACSSCTNTSVTQKVDVKVPDLIPFLALPFRSQQWNPVGIGARGEHLDNHYLTVAATYRLLEVAAKYRKIWPTAPALTLNDGSLKWGGKFDIDGSWDRVKGRHGEHRVGENIDIRANSGPGNVPSSIRDTFFKWLRDEGTDEDKIPSDLRIRSVNPLWENPGEVNEHFHLRLGN